jgi:hypothetical protein
MCKEKKACTKCQNKSKSMGAVGKVKRRKASGTKKRTMRRRSRVSGLGGTFDIEELALIAAGALGAKMLVNPLGKAIFRGKAESERPKYFPLIAKGALAYGLTMLKMKQADQMAKGAALSALLEGAEMLAPTIFAPKLKADVNGYDDDIVNGVELNLDDINGYGDDDINGYGEDNAVAGYGDDGAVAGGVM